MKEIYEPSFDAIKKQKPTLGVYEKFEVGYRDFDFKMADEIISKGAFDVHIHARPCSFLKRPWSMSEVAIQACEKGMKGVVFKSHATSSAACIEFIQEIVDRWAVEHEKKKIKTIGGTVLNYPVGGINPSAVEACARFGGKFIWLPSIHASHHYKVQGQNKGIEVLDSKDRVIPELKQIFDIISKNDMVLVLGHQSVKERLIIIDEAKEHGVKRILADHPSWWINKATPEQQSEMAKKGVYIGLYWCAVLPNSINLIDPKEALDVLNVVPVDMIVGGSDCCSNEFPTPPEAIRQLVTFLLFYGVDRDIVEKIFVHNPNKLIYD